MDEELRSYFTIFGGNCWEALLLLAFELVLELKNFERFWDDDYFGFCKVFWVFEEE
jgi:hypothetical protein